MKTIETIKKEFEDLTLIKMFEIPVINKKTGESDFILFDILVSGNYLKAQHEGLTTLDLNSDKIAFKQIEIDDCFSLDQNLQELYSVCLQAIIDSDFFTLTED